MWLRRLFTRGLQRRPILEPKRAYELWAATYPGSAPNPFMLAEQAAIEPRLALLRARSAIDLGSGSGRGISMLRGAGVERVIGLDFSLDMLALDHGTTPLVCADATAPPFRDRSFDLALACLVAGHLPDLEAWGAAVGRILRSGGHLVYSDVHPNWQDSGWQRTFTTPGGRTHAVRQHWRSIDEQRDALAAAGFEILDVIEPRLGEADAVSTVSAVSLDDWHRRWGDPPVALIVIARWRTGPVR